MTNYAEINFQAMLTFAQAVKNSVTNDYHII